MEQIGTAATTAIQRADTAAASPATRSTALALPVKRDADGVPELHDPDYRKLARLAVWKADRGLWELLRPLTAAERAALGDRSAALAASLRPFEDKERARLEATISAMFSGKRSMWHQGDDVEGTVQITLGVLGEFPAWAIIRGCIKIARKGFIRNGVTVLDKPPNDSEICDTVAGIVREYSASLRETQKLIEATAPAPAPPRSPSGHLASVAPRTEKPVQRPPLPGDGSHAKRIAADLAARKARNEAQGNDGGAQA
jgi:hypothetical protein